MKNISLIVTILLLIVSLGCGQTPVYAEIGKSINDLENSGLYGEEYNFKRPEKIIPSYSSDANKIYFFRDEYRHIYTLGFMVDKSKNILAQSLTFSEEECVNASVSLELMASFIYKAIGQEESLDEIKAIVKEMAKKLKKVNELTIGASKHFKGYKIDIFFHLASADWEVVVKK